MSTVIQVELPDGFRQVLANERGETTLSRWALEALVTEAVRERLISRGKGGEILGLDFQDRERFYAERVVLYDLTEEELASDRKNLEATLRKRC